LSSASHLVGAPTSTRVGPTEEKLVAVLNREMERRRQEEQRAVEARRIQLLETERLRRQSLESKEPCHPLLSLCRPLTHERLDSQPPKNRESSTNITIVACNHLRHWQSRRLSVLTLRQPGSDNQCWLHTCSCFTRSSSTEHDCQAQCSTYVTGHTKTSTVVFTTAQSSRIVADTPTVTLPKPILTPDVAMPSGTISPIPVSTAAVPEIPTAAVSTAPIVIVRQLKELS